MMNVVGMRGVAGLLAAAAVFAAGSAAAQDSPQESARAQAAPAQAYDYRVLATNRTSTMQREMNEAADAGFRFEDVMGGETAFGGNEVVVAMSRTKADQHEARYEYRLLATSRTGTMQREMQEAGDAGFEYRGQTVFKTTFGGSEVVVILERDRTAPLTRYEYRLLATSRSSTMQRELQEAGDAGFAFVGITVASTRMGGNEIVTILRREVAE